MTPEPTLKLLFAVISTAVLTASLIASDYPVMPVPFTAVHVTGGFWQPRQETNRTVTVPAQVLPAATGWKDLLGGGLVNRKASDSLVVGSIEARGFRFLATLPP